MGMSSSRRRWRIGPKFAGTDHLAGVYCHAVSILTRCRELIPLLSWSGYLKNVEFETYV
jgi:hypothetical protein